MMIDKKICVWNMVKKQYQEDTDLLGEEPLLFPLDPPEIPHEMAWN
jgi:hypothetical protein